MKPTIASNPPGRPRNPLARQIAAQFAMKETLFGDPLLTLSEARLALNCSYAHVRRLISDGRLQVWRSSPTGHMRVRVSEVRRFIAAGFNDQSVPAVQS
jgi:excisionase family DNA binding protein